MPQLQERIQALTSQVSGSQQAVSIEGQPLYSTTGLSSLESFVYGKVIPLLISNLSKGTVLRVEALHTQGFTGNFSAEDSADALTTELEQVPVNSRPDVVVTNYNDPELLTVAREIIKSLTRTNRAVGGDNLKLLTVPGQKSVYLTNSAGIPTAPVIDAAYQLHKADSGAEVGIIIHSADYKVQQQGMLNVLQAFTGLIPFSALYHVFIRNRMDGLQVGGIVRRSRNGKVSHV